MSSFVHTEPSVLSLNKGEKRGNKSRHRRIFSLFLGIFADASALIKLTMDYNLYQCCVLTYKHKICCLLIIINNAYI